MIIRRILPYLWLNLKLQKKQIMNPKKTDNVAEELENVEDTNSKANERVHIKHKCGKGMVAVAAVGITLINVAILIGSELSRK